MVALVNKDNDQPGTVRLCRLSERTVTGDGTRDLDQSKRQVCAAAVPDTGDAAIYCHAVNVGDRGWPQNLSGYVESHRTSKPNHQTVMQPHFRYGKSCNHGSMGRTAKNPCAGWLVLKC